jgi:hypothetical protein
MRKNWPLLCKIKYFSPCKKMICIKRSVSRTGFEMNPFQLPRPLRPSFCRFVLYTIALSVRLPGIEPSTSRVRGWIQLDISISRLQTNCATIDDMYKCLAYMMLHFQARALGGVVAATYHWIKNEIFYLFNTEQYTEAQMLNKNRSKSSNLLNFILLATCNIYKRLIFYEEAYVNSIGSNYFVLLR